jgi:signal transduction histidine kinase
MADAERVRQILSNLIYNAIKFTNTGGIVVSAKAGEGCIQVAVQDTGVGIPSDKLESVFKKFECLKDTKNRVNKPVPGSGLGLNIVQNSVKAQGGKIWVESEVDKGSSFIFTLPLAPAGAEAKRSLMGPASDVGYNKELVFNKPEHVRQPVIIEEKSRNAA